MRREGGSSRLGANAGLPAEAPLVLRGSQVGNNFGDRVF